MSRRLAPRPARGTLVLVLGPALSEGALRLAGAAPPFGPARLSIP